MKLLRAADRRTMPWKNGGGSTAEIISRPEGAGLDAFDWRVSIATVESDGPFSVFPGIDRTLAMIEGAGIELAVEGRPPVSMGWGGEPALFPGDVAASAKLRRGPIRDLNVMSRREAFTHRMVQVESREVRFTAGVETALLVAIGGSVWIVVESEDIELGPDDALLLDPVTATKVWQASIDGADCYLVEIARKR